MANYSVQLDKYSTSGLLGNSKEIPLLRVTFNDIMGLGEMRNIMSEINEVTKNIEEPYISLTDFTQLNINKLFEKVLTFGMEASYKSFLGVDNPATISFVMISDSGLDDDVFKQRLLDINDQEVDEKFKYNYIFINQEEEMEPYVRQESNIFEVG